MIFPDSHISYISKSGASLSHRKVSELTLHRRRRSISGDGFFIDGDYMHVTDGLSSSSESPQLRSTTYASSLLSSSTEASPLHREGEQGVKEDTKQS
ncbi:hypothetical protein F2Q68_00011522 [Brassica cretica]|uniref:Uncharacterized protein n=1 Tax=Brassica cretica TaxID=69181 RepID=A0A8S9KZS5_BRACR|nr:hypothetical protein F2Q68_00011522 [Brassica cretica]